MPRVFRVLLLLLVSAGLAASLYGQGQNATIVGVVTDSSGAPIADATVLITDEDRGTKHEVKTSAHGNYTVPQLQPSENYIVQVNKAGFNAFVQRGISLDVAQTTEVNVQLKLGSADTSVDVYMDAAQIDTQTSSLGQVINGDTVADLPLNGRSTFRLIELTPGVTFNDSAQGQFGDVPVNTTWDSNFSINGGRAMSNEFLIDGIPTATGFFNQITTMPIVDELQQFKVESSNLSASYGRFSGGVINVVTKAGTNKYHGDLFYFVRNPIFDAWEWFTKQQYLLSPTTVSKPNLKMHQFGGTVGGPLSIPWLYNGHDHTFFFVSYQGTRRVESDPTFFNVPTLAMRKGDFSGISNRLWNPFSIANTTNGNRTELTTRIIPSGLISPVAQFIVKNFYPEPNVPNVSAAGTNAYFDATPNRVQQDVYSLRVDQNVTSRWHMFGRFAYSDTRLQYADHFHNVATPGSGAVGKTGFHNMSFALNSVYTVSPSFLINASYGFARWYQKKQTRSYGFDLGSLNANWGELSAQGLYPVFPNFTFNGFASLGGQVVVNNSNDAHSLLIQATKVFGRHEFVFGADVRMKRINSFSVGTAAGSYAFTQQFTRQGPNTTAGGNSMASFMMGAGAPTTGNGSAPLQAGNALQNFYGAVYFQDNWRITSRLTLNLGVRYDGESPQTDRHNYMNTFDPDVVSLAANPTYPNLRGGLVFATENGLGREVYSRDHFNVAPRIGFAYSPNQDLVFRGAYGISYAPIDLSNNAVGFVPNLGFSSSSIWNTAYTPAGTGEVLPRDLIDNPYPSGLVPIAGSANGTLTQIGQSLTVWHKGRIPSPYVNQYNLDIQINMPSRSLLDVAYAGSQMVHITSPFNLNTLSFDTKAAYMTQLLANTTITNPFPVSMRTGVLANNTLPLTQSLLPFPQFSSIVDVNNPWGHSNYNALQVKFVKRDAKGLTILTAYTWSKNLSNVNAGTGIGDNTNNTGVQDYYHLEDEKAVSEIDMNHIFITHFVYDLPFGKRHRFLNHGGWQDVVFGGWKVSALWREQAGFPLSIAATGSTGGGIRANLVPGQDPILHGKRSNIERVKAWFNTSAFSVPDAYTPGSVRRTFPAIRRPGLQNVDVTLMKENHFFERLRTQFRFESFNLFNNPHFNAPGDTDGGTNFGVVTSTKNSPPPRRFQAALKIFF